MPPAIPIAPLTAGTPIRAIELRGSDVSAERPLCEAVALSRCARPPVERRFAAAVLRLGALRLAAVLRLGALRLAPLRLAPLRLALRLAALRLLAPRPGALWRLVLLRAGVLAERRLLDWLEEPRPLGPDIVHLLLFHSHRYDDGRERGLALALPRT
jgi:hypothetical protein